MTEPTSPRIRTACAIIVGSEILSGKIDDRHLGALARTLRTLGVRLAQDGVTDAAGNLSQRLIIDFDTGTITGEDPVAAYSFAGSAIVLVGPIFTLAPDAGTCFFRNSSTLV